METAAPSNFEQLVTVTQYEMLGYLRKKRIWLVLGTVFAIFFLLLLIFPAQGISYPATFSVFSRLFVSFSGVLVLLCATLFGADALVSEFQHKTGFVIFPNPIKRTVIGLGKFAASMITSIIVIALYYGLIALFVGGIYKTVTVEFGYSFLLALLYLAAAMGVAYMVGALMRSALASILLVFILFIFIFSLIEGVSALAGFKPWFLITFTGGTISYIMDVPYPTDSMLEIPMGPGQTMTVYSYYPELGVSIAVMVAYIVICLVIALIRFNRKEMVG